jgi:hypothetical protein
VTEAGAGAPEDDEFGDFDDFAAAGGTLHVSMLFNLSSRLGACRNPDICSL